VTSGHPADATGEPHETQEREPQAAAAPASGVEESVEEQSVTEQEQAATQSAEDPQRPAEDQDLAGDTPDDLVAELAAAQAQVATLTNDLQRLQAEYVNYKRRVDRDRELVLQNAKFSVLSAMLPVLDDLDRARQHGELEGGFKAVADSLERIVASQGLVKFGKPGDEFDPNYHEALMHAHSPDVTTTTCQNIVSAGYQIGDRVVRPAQVTVVDPEPASAPAAAGDDTGNENK
jgi:molecular chaperone GrpE